MKLKLVKKVIEAPQVKSFFWETERQVRYLPGQFYYFTLPELYFDDQRGPTRHFTISSSPTEDNLIRFTTRIREESGYKKTLDNLKIGAEIEGEGPSGTFILDENEPPTLPAQAGQAGKGQHVLISGGIGITPFRSFIKYALDKNLTDIKLHLIYSSQTLQQIIFQKELTTWAEKYQNLKVDMTITQPNGSLSKWDGLTGRINESLIKKVISVKQLLISNFWISGPPVMVYAIKTVLSNLKISSIRIRNETFTGY